MTSPSRRLRAVFDLALRFALPATLLACLGIGSASAQAPASVGIPGNYQSEAGCGGDWDPGCFRSWLQDIQGSGVYRFSTNAIPAGSYECKVALNGSWDVNYGADGVQNGANISFTVPADGMDVEFEWNSNTKVLRVIVGGIQGDLSKAKAYWLSADTIAWNVPTDTVVSLFADPDGALTIDGPGIVAGGAGRLKVGANSTARASSRRTLATASAISRGK